MARYALVIGIAKYNSPLLSNLSKTVTDAEAVAEIFRQYGNCEQVTLLKGEVTAAQLGQGLKTLLLEQAVNNEALIYITGHGITGVTGADILEKPQGYLAASDCNLSKSGDFWLVRGGGISLSSLNELIKKSNLSNLVIILDTCHSGEFLEQDLVRSSFTTFDSKTDYCLITSCRSFEQSWAKKSEQHSVFTGALIAALSSKNAKKNGQVTVDGAFDFIASELKQSRQEPIRMGKGRSINLVSYSPEILIAKSSLEAKSSSLKSTTDNRYSPSLNNNNIFKILPLSWNFIIFVFTILFTVIGWLIFANPDWIGYKKSQLKCIDPELAKKPETIRIAIANFAENSDRNLEESLMSQLSSQFRVGVTICRIDQEVNSKLAAIELGESFKYKAALVIWGSISDNSFIGGLEVIEKYLEDSDLQLDPDKQLNTYLRGDLSEVVSLLSNFSVSQIYIFQEKPWEAQKILQSALDKTSNCQSNKFTKINNQQLSELYFSLGILYHDNDSLNPALKAYQCAFNIDSTRFDALFQQAVIYTQIEKNKEAIKIYQEIIEKNPSSSTDALVNRGLLFADLNQCEKAEKDFVDAIQFDKLFGLEMRATARFYSCNNLQGAIEDLQELCQLNPPESCNYQFLGEAQLRLGKIAGAEETYQKARNYLEQEEKETLINDLKSLGEGKSELKNVTDRMIAILKGN